MELLNKYPPKAGELDIVYNELKNNPKRVNYFNWSGGILGVFDNRELTNYRKEEDSVPDFLNFNTQDFLDAIDNVNKLNLVNSNFQEVLYGKPLRKQFTRKVLIRLLIILCCYLILYYYYGKIPCLYSLEIILFSIIVDKYFSKNKIKNL